MKTFIGLKAVALAAATGAFLFAHTGFAEEATKSAPTTTSSSSADLLKKRMDLEFQARQLGLTLNRPVQATPDVDMSSESVEVFDPSTSNIHDNRSASMENLVPQGPERQTHDYRYGNAWGHGSYYNSYSPYFSGGVYSHVY